MSWRLRPLTRFVTRCFWSADDGVYILSVDALLAPSPAVVTRRVASSGHELQKKTQNKLNTTKESTHRKSYATQRNRSWENVRRSFLQAAAASDVTRQKTRSNMLWWPRAMATYFIILTFSFEVNISLTCHRGHRRRVDHVQLHRSSSQVSRMNGYRHHCQVCVSLYKVSIFQLNFKIKPRKSPSLI